MFADVLFVLKKIQNKSKMVYVGNYVLMRVLMKKILVIDDSPINLKLVTKALESTYEVIPMKSGAEALEYLKQNRVDLVLLDILMPDMDGFEVYIKIRKTYLNHNVPVAFLTADEETETEIRGLKMGAVDFIRKPFVPQIMLHRINRILQLEALNRNLEDVVKEKTGQIEQLSFEIISTIASMIEAKDSYTKGHSVRVAEYSALIAKELNWSEEDVQNLKYIALLHDIGKVGIPDNILNKPGKLTDSEFNIIRSHTTLAGNILKDIRTISDVDAGAKYHHERYDGKGYPGGLGGDNIPVVARIIGIADAYDAMNSKRVYRDALPKEVIRKEIEGGRGTQFDPAFTDIFLSLMDEGKLDIDFDKADRERTLTGEGSALINQIMQSIEEEVKKAESMDPLTGLFSRKEGEKRIRRSMKQNVGCLAFIDLDNLKRTNDTMGHLAGDHALKTVGEVLSTHGKDAIILRMGGDEFVYYMSGVNKEQAEDRISRIISSFEEKRKGDAYLSVSTLSIGLCMTTAEDGYTDVVKKADRALYYVKQSGKCGYYFYNSDINNVRNRHSVDLKRLVENLRAQGAYKGTLNVEYREFAKIYDYVQHLGDRYQYNIKLVLITLDFGGRENVYIDERERAMTCMEKTIQASLRSVDVCTRFSGEQFVVILMNSQDEYTDVITGRIDTNFRKIYDPKMVGVQFDVADLSSEEYRES